MTGRLAVAAAVVALIAGPLRAAPDLVLDTTLMSPTFDLHSFAPDACELQSVDKCIAAPGARKLLRFGVLAVNEGDDLVVGIPTADNPMFVYSQCHNHYHFESFAKYELRRADGTGTPIPGQKRSFCIEDSRVASSTAPAKYCCRPDCQFGQGIQHGWGDVYPANLPCQWIDITDAAPGDYRLCVELNYESPFRLFESNYDNNTGCVDVHIGATAPKSVPRVRVSAPSRGAKVRIGRKMRVAWQRHLRRKSAVLFQELWLSTDGGATWRFVTNRVGARAQTYRWILPADVPPTEDARVRVVVGVRIGSTGGAETYQTGTATSGRFRVVP